MRVALVGGVVFLVLGCATPSGPTGQGGASFRASSASRPAASAEQLYAVCWPADSAPGASVTLSFQGADVFFEAKGGASNSTGRCLREIATSYPFDARPSGTVEVMPSPQGPLAFAVLAWARLLAESRYGPERGVVDPAPLAAACLAQGTGVRPGTRFEVNPGGQPGLRVVPGATTDTERCLEGVLAATVWPSTRSFSLDFEGAPRAAPAAAPSGDVALYFGPAGAAPAPLDPQRVHDAFVLKNSAVSVCWEAALSRRATIGGGRTVRFRVDDAGRIERAWVGGNLSDSSTAAADLLLDRCLIDVARGVRLEGGGAGEGLYSWVFAQRG